MLSGISEFIAASKDLMSLFTACKELLPKGEDRERIDQAIRTANRELTLAEAAMAQSLQYDLCKCTFPPQIMLFKSMENKTVCPACQHSISRDNTCYVAKMPSRWDDY